MHPRGCDDHPNGCKFALAAKLWGLTLVLALASSGAAQQQALRRMPTPSRVPAHDSASDTYDPLRTFHCAWNQPGMHWYANWSPHPALDHTMVDAYEAIFQDPHAEDVPPPPGTVLETPPSGRLADGQTIGEEPEDYNVQFLRQQSVLLNQGDWQLDYGVQYALTENDIPIAVVNGLNEVTGVVEGRTKSRLLLTPVEFRYGLTERMQGFVNVPLGWSHSEISFTDFDDFSSEIGIGDVSAGLSILLCDGCQYKPDIVATLGFTAPTGDADFPLLTTLTPNSVLGEGYWAASAQLLFIHTYDPIVLFWGLGYRHRFEEEFVNPVTDIAEDFRPGETFFYQCGVGFGVNEWITLSTSFAGAYVSELYVDGDRVEGTIREPLRLRFALTINTQAKLIEPFTELGMTDDTVDARFGVTWTHTHRNCSGGY